MCFNIKKKKEQNKNRKIYFIDADSLIRKGRAQNYLDKDHINEIFTIYSNYRDLINFSKVVTLDEIKKNNYDLNISLYIDQQIQEDDISLNEIKNEITSLWKKILEEEKNFKKDFINFFK